VIIKMCLVKVYDMIWYGWRTYKYATLLIGLWIWHTRLVCHIQRPI